MRIVILLCVGERHHERCRSLYFRVVYIVANRGRPDKYQECVEPYLAEIKDMALTMTEEQIAKTLGVSRSMFCRYKDKYPELGDAVKCARRTLVKDLHSSLIKRAMGYEFQETRVRYSNLEMSDDLYRRLKDDGYTDKELKRIKVSCTEVTMKHMPPDVAALNLALKNFDPKGWANDPQMMELRKKELELRKKHLEAQDW